MHIQVRPIDPAAPGSWGQQRRLARALRTLQQPDVARVDLVAALEALAAVLVEFARHEDGRVVTPEDLDELSIDDVIALVSAVRGEELPEVQDPLASSGSTATPGARAPARNGSSS